MVTNGSPFASFLRSMQIIVLPNLFDRGCGFRVSMLAHIGGGGPPQSGRGIQLRNCLATVGTRPDTSRQNTANAEESLSHVRISRSMVLLRIF